MKKASLRRSMARTAAAVAVMIALALGPADAARQAGAPVEQSQSQARTEALPPLRIEITGQRFQWHVHYPGPDGELGTKDDLEDRQNVRVPLGRDVELVLHSRDYLYSLALPHVGLKEIAVPDLTFSLRLTPDRVGTFELLGDQFCGYAHPDLMGEFVVMTQSDFEKWTPEGSSSSPPSGGSE